jgi:hypothetical protein
MPSITEQLEDFVEAERSLRQEALASSETDAQPGEEQSRRSSGSLSSESPAVQAGNAIDAD